LKEQIKELAKTATLHKVAAKLQPYVHSMFALIDADPVMNKIADDSIHTVTPAMYAPVYVSTWDCSPQYPMQHFDTPDSNNVTAVPTQAFCANMLLRHEAQFFITDRDKATLTIDHIWEMYASDKFPMPFTRDASDKLPVPFTGEEQFSSQLRNVILTTTGFDMSVNEATKNAQRFLKSIDDVNCDSDVVIFAFHTIYRPLREIIHGIYGDSQKRRVFIYPIHRWKMFHNFSVDEWRYSLWGSFLSRFRVIYLNSMHVHDIRAIFQTDPFKTIDHRNGLALFTREMIPKRMAVDVEWMEKSGHCWPDIPPQKFQDVPLLGAGGDPTADPPIAPGFVRKEVVKKFWTPAQVVSGVAVGTVGAHANLFVHVLNGMSQRRDSSCSLNQFLHRMVWNLDLAVSFPLTVYNQESGPVLPALTTVPLSKGLIQNQHGGVYSVVVIDPNGL
jgi:hypothetical protein